MVLDPCVQRTFYKLRLTHVLQCTYGKRTLHFFCCVNTALCYKKGHACKICMLYHWLFKRQDEVQALVTDLWNFAILPCPIAFTNDPRTNVQFVVKFRWHFWTDKIWSPRAFSSSDKLKAVVIATSLRSQSVSSGLKLRPDACSGTWFVGANSLCLLVDFRPAVMGLPVIVPDLVVIPEMKGKQTGARWETGLVQVLRYGIFITFHPLPASILLCE